MNVHRPWGGVGELRTGRLAGLARQRPRPYGLWGLRGQRGLDRSADCGVAARARPVRDLEQALALTSKGRAQRPVEPHEGRPPRVMIRRFGPSCGRFAYEQKVPLRGLVCAGLNAVVAQHHKPEIAR